SLLLPDIPHSHQALISTSPPVQSFLVPYVTATPDLYPLSLHDALPILAPLHRQRFRLAPGHQDLGQGDQRQREEDCPPARGLVEDRKSTRLNSSHVSISYAVFCLKKKK